MASSGAYQSYGHYHRRESHTYSVWLKVLG